MLPSMNEAVVDREDQLTPEWLTGALQSAGHELVVAGAESEPIGTGQMGMTYRLRLAYDGQPGPATLVAKVAGPSEELRALVAPGYAAELGFYRGLADGLTVRVPRCWYAAITGDNTSFTLLLEDAAPAMPGVQANGCTVTQAEAALDNLVGLHAPRWNDPELLGIDTLMRTTEEGAEMMGAALRSAMVGFLERYDAVLAEDDSATLRDAADAIVDWQLARPEPFTVVHGDYRLDNLLFSPDDREVIAVDWQAAAVGPALRDVAYFLGTSLHTEDRRSEEERLVAGYHNALVARGVSDYDADRCWDDYRLGQLQGPMITVIGCMYASGERSEASDAMFLAMARRSCASIRELRSLELV